MNASPSHQFHSHSESFGADLEEAITASLLGSVNWDPSLHGLSLHAPETYTNGRDVGAADQATNQYVDVLRI